MWKGFEAMDLRITKTYAALTAAFTSLLEEKPYEKISVAQLCEASQIRRTTFYKHFADKDEFFQFYVKHLRDDFKQATGADDADMPLHERRKLMLQRFIAFLLQHEKLVDHVIYSPSATLLLDALGEMMSLDAESMVSADDQTAIKGTSAATRATFLAGGAIQMLKRWWKQGHTEEGSKELLAIMEQIAL